MCTFTTSYYSLIWIVFLSCRIENHVFITKNLNKFLFIWDMNIRFVNIIIVICSIKATSSSRPTFNSFNFFSIGILIHNKFDVLSYLWWSIWSFSINMCRLSHEMLLISIGIVYFNCWFVVIAGLCYGDCVRSTAIVIMLIFLPQLLLYSWSFSAWFTLLISLLQFPVVIYSYFRVPVYSWKITDILWLYFLNFIKILLKFIIDLFILISLFVINWFNSLIFDDLPSAFNKLIQSFLQRLHIHNATVIINGYEWSFIFFLLFLLYAFHVFLFLVLSESLQLFAVFCHRCRLILLHDTINLDDVFFSLMWTDRKNFLFWKKCFLTGKFH